MLIYVIRHGETDYNKAGRFQGSSDAPLNEFGIELAALTGTGMQGIHFDACYSSPLLRARQTAEILLEKSGNLQTPIIMEPRIQEIHMGTWEEKKFRPEECEVDWDRVMVFYKNPFLFGSFPEGENAEEVCKRTQEFLKELIARDDDKTYLVSTHGFAMRAMLNFLYEDSSDFWQKQVPYNCAVNLIRVTGGKAEFAAEECVYYSQDKCIDRYRIEE